jgi:membrane carboxypeptidase/penicillin-binding protein PbpC
MQDKRADAIDEKLEKITEKLSSIDVTLAVNTQSLVEHVKRTNLLEAELKPVSKHVVMMETTFKVIGIVGSAAAFILGCLKLIF